MKKRSHAMVMPLLKRTLGFGVAAALAVVAGVTGCDRNPSSTSDNEVIGAGPGVEAAADAGDAPIRRVCPSNRHPDGSWVTVDGFDVSDWQFTDWDKVAASNPHHKFSFVRISAGLVRVDTRFRFDWPSAKRVGFIRGAYQYFKPSQSAIAQADLYLRRLNEEGGLEATDFPPVLDVETTNDMPIETVVCRVKTWLARVERATRRVPIVYTSHRHAYLFEPSAKRYPLWVANYVGTPSVTCPRMPDPWDKWHFWQWTETGRIPGVHPNGSRDVPDGGSVLLDEAGAPVIGGFDLNFWDGTLAELRAYVAASTSTGEVEDPPPLANPPVVPGATSTVGDPVDCADDGCCRPGPAAAAR